MSTSRKPNTYLTKRVRRNLEIQERIKTEGIRSYKGLPPASHGEKLDMPTEKERQKLMKQKLKEKKRADQKKKKQKKQENAGK